VHAGVAARAYERDKVERLCRYVSRPPVAESRLSLTPNGDIRYDVNGITNVASAWMRRSDRLKTPYREGLPHERSECFGYGTTHVIFQPLDFLPQGTFSIA
jgi:hypothetical protein